MTQTSGFNMDPGDDRRAAVFENRFCFLASWRWFRLVARFILGVCRYEMVK